MSTLLHPIHGTREKFRPKHQVLILRCYPKYQKQVQDVRPNSSELSYLLYYASSRRSKLQKVGIYLEKKTSSDLWRQKLGNVQVTLQILTSIIEKSPRDLALYGSSVLAILGQVLGSKDINMIEDSLPVWESYCKYVEAASLSADRARFQQYRQITEKYVSLARVEVTQISASSTSSPTSRRWRTIALRAIRAVVGSDALAVDTSEQLGKVMPIILENLNLEDANSIAPLQRMATRSERQSAEAARKRRMSSAAVIPTVEQVVVTPPVSSETTADADKAAEEEVRVLAVRCLEQIFSGNTGNSRSYMRYAVAQVLRFITAKHVQRPLSRATATMGPAPDWATTLFETLAKWTPVSDRFIIVVVTVETLVRQPFVEDVLNHQVVLASLVDWLLRSDINLIGLSVMDILLRLIQHALLLLQLGAKDATSTPIAVQTDTLNLYSDLGPTLIPTEKPANVDELRKFDTQANKPSPLRIELLNLLQRCISDLATHIYYTDQISDMMTAILVRLKPSTLSAFPSTVTAIEDPEKATEVLAKSGGIQEDPTTSDFFSFATARMVALKAVKDIQMTANKHRTSSGAHAEVRSRVGVHVWDGTQWLLKDEDFGVRAAYVDALVTWLRLETNKNDLLLPREGPRKDRSKKDVNGDKTDTLTRRAVSNASRREPKPTKSTFLQLLHLAIYDSAVERSDTDADMLLLLLLLWTLVERLGVNALRTGLPMVMSLQDASLRDEGLEVPARVRIASLCQGYFWAVAHKFDFEGTAAGHEINAEISRRKRAGCWFDRIKFPPSTVAQITASSSRPGTAHYNDQGASSIKPYLDVQNLVENVSDSYNASLISPPSSPLASPGRVFSVPTLGYGYGFNNASPAKPARESMMPQSVKDEMCGTWSREACILNIDKENNPSLHGSKTGNSLAGRQNLSMMMSPQDSTPGDASPLYGQGEGPGISTLPNTSHGLGSLARANDFSTSSFDAESSSRDSTTRVSDLKHALASSNGFTREHSHSPLRRPVSRSRVSAQSEGSESMMSYNQFEDESAVNSLHAIEEHAAPSLGADTSVSPTITYHDVVTADLDQADQDIPPVPPLPSALNSNSNSTLARELIASYQPSISASRPDTAKTVSARPSTAKSKQRASNRPQTSAGAESRTTADRISMLSDGTARKRRDLGDLLASIKVSDEDAAGNDDKNGGRLGQEVGNKDLGAGERMIRPPF